MELKQPPLKGIHTKQPGVDFPLAPCRCSGDECHRVPWPTRGQLAVWQSVAGSVEHGGDITTGTAWSWTACRSSSRCSSSLHALHGEGTRASRPAHTARTGSAQLELRSCHRGGMRAGGVCFWLEFLRGAARGVEAVV